LETGTTTTYPGAENEAPFLDVRRDDDSEEPGGQPKEAVLDKAAELDDLRQMQEFFISNHRDVFEQISKTSRLAIRPGNGFRIIYGKTPVVELDSYDWQKMKNGEFSEEQMIWSTMHEIAHFQDMMDDPEAMSSHFEYMKQKAKNTAPKARRVWRDALVAKGEDLPDYVTDDYLERFIYDQLHGFYNSLDDVYVNNLVAVDLAFRYSRDSGSRTETVSNLYSDYLFKEQDYTSRSKSKQLGYAILRRHMVPDQSASFSPEIDQALRTQVSLGGVKRPLSELVNGFLTPSSKVIPKEKQNTPGRRYQFFINYLEPSFWNLFWEDLKNFPPPKKKEKQEGDQGEEGDEGEGGGGSPETPPDVGDENENEGGENGEKAEEDEDKDSKSGEPDQSESDDNEPNEKPSDKEGEGSGDDNPWDEINQENPIGKETVEDFLKSKAEYEEANKPLEVKKTEKLTPEEALKSRNIKYDAELAEKYSKLSPEQAKQVAESWQEYYESVRPYIEELSAVFDMILNTINSQISEAWQEGFRTGRLNLPYFIEKYGIALAAGELEGNISKFIDFSKLDTYDQKEFTSRLKIYPNNIVFRLMMDNSGSMEGLISDGDKQFPKILSSKQLMVLMYESLISFQERVNHNFRLNQPFVVDIQVQTFGDKTTLAKPLGVYGEQERGLMVASLAYMSADEGSTIDNQVWENATAEIANDPEKQKVLKDGSAQDISIEVTDGDTRSEEATVAAIKDYLALAGKGSANGIKIIGKEETEEKYRASTFNRVFQGNGRPVRNAAEFSQAMVDLLSEKLTTMQQIIKVKQETTDDFGEE